MLRSQSSACSQLLNDPPARVLARDKFMGSRRVYWVDRPGLLSMTLLPGQAASVPPVVGTSKHYRPRHRYAFETLVS